MSRASDSHSLGNYVRIRTGKLDANASSLDGEYPFFTCAIAPLKISTFSFDCECVLVAGNGDLNVKYYKGKFDAYQRTYVIEAIDTSTLDVRYLYHFLSQYVVHLRHLSIGGVIKYIKLENLTEAQIPLPPLPEQHRIAAILDKADALRQKRRAALAKLDELLQSVFVEMFGDPVTNPHKWKVLTLGELIPDKGMIVDGPFGSTLKPDAYIESGIRVIRNFNIKDDAFDAGEFKYISESKYQEIVRSEVRPGDILISTKGTVGNVCLMPNLVGTSVLSASGTVRLRLANKSQIINSFLVSQMIRPSFKTYIRSFESGSIQRYLNLSSIRNIKVIVPPLKLQEDYLLVRKQVIGSLKQMYEAQGETDGLFASLQARAFAGEL